MRESPWVSDKSFPIPQAEEDELAVEAAEQRSNMNSETKGRRDLSRGQGHVKTKQPTGHLDHTQVGVKEKEGTEKTPSLSHYLLQRDRF